MSKLDAWRRAHPKLIVVGANTSRAISTFHGSRHRGSCRRPLDDGHGAHHWADHSEYLHPAPVPYCDVVAGTTHKTLAAHVRA